MSCQIQKGAVGTYSSSKSSLASHTLKLYSDNTFQYTIAGGLLNQHSEGLWSICESGEISLTSYEKFKPGIISVNETEIQSDKIWMNVTDDVGDPLPFASIILIDSLGQSHEYSLSENGTIEIDLISLIYFKLNYLGNTYEYNVNKRDSNNFEIIIRLIDHAVFYIQDKKLTRQGNTLMIDSFLTLIKYRGT